MSEKIEQRIISNNIVETMGTHKKLVDGLKQIPIHKMYEQIQYLQNQVLPQAKQKLGEESEGYKFYSSLVDSLIWGIKINQQYERLAATYSRERFAGNIMQQMYNSIENELLKYTTLENLYLNMAMDDYKNAVETRINNMQKES